MAEFGNGLAEESLLDSDPGHPELEDPGVGDEEPGLEEGEAAIEDPVSEGHCCHWEVQRYYPTLCGQHSTPVNPSVAGSTRLLSLQIAKSHAVRDGAPAGSISTAIVAHAVQ